MLYAVDSAWIGGDEHAGLAALPPIDSVADALQQAGMAGISVAVTRDEDTAALPALLAGLESRKLAVVSVRLSLDVRAPQPAVNVGPLVDALRGRQTLLQVSLWSSSEHDPAS